MTFAVRDYFDTTIAREFFDLFAGDKIGHGIGRQVFACRHDANVVIKLEVGSFSFQNQHEWDFWDQVGSTKLAKWFAPPVRISPCGSILIQRRTTPIPFDFKMPKKIPAICGDLKKENWGLLDGRVVCHDYGRMNTFYAGWKGFTKEKTAKWWSQHDGIGSGEADHNKTKVTHE